MLDIKNFKKNFKKFKGFKLITLEDSNMILKWRNCEHVRMYMNNTEIINKKTHKFWFQKILFSETDLYFIYEQDNKPIGLVCFNHINLNEKTAYWGFYLSEKNLPAGTGTNMLKNALLLSINEIFLDKVYANVIPSNTKSYYIHTKLGFKETDGFLVLNNQPNYKID